MTAQDVKDYISATLKPLRSIAQEISVLNKIVDFVSELFNIPAADTELINTWAAALVFNIDGSGDGAFCTYNDTNGQLRFWNTQVDNNTGNMPPTDPDVHENLFWKEVSPAYGTSIRQWAAGFYGSGVQIVFDTGSLYYLNVAARPFNSTNFITELAAGQWVKAGGTNTASNNRLNYYRFSSDLFTEQALSYRGLISGLAIMFTGQLSAVTFSVRLDASNVWVDVADVVALQTWITANVAGNEATGTIYWIKANVTYAAGKIGDAEARLSYTAS